MSKKRLINFIISIVAVSLIIYVVVENLGKEEPDSEITFSNGNTNEEAGDSEASKIDEEKDQSSSTSETKAEVGLERGMLAPDFTLTFWGTEEEGTLSSFRGEIVVLNLWASWCPPCKREMPDLISLYEDYKGKGVTVVGVNMSTLERSEGATDEFMEEYNVTFPTFIDHADFSVNLRGVVENLYQVRSIPATYILDEEGKIFVSIRGEVNYEMIDAQIKKLLN